MELLGAYCPGGRRRKGRAKGAEVRAGLAGTFFSIPSSQAGQTRVEEIEGRLPQHFKEAWSVGGRIPFPMVWCRIPQSAICVTMENTVKPSAKSLLTPHNPTTLFKAHFKSVFPSPLKIENFEDQKPQVERTWYVGLETS